MQCHRLALGVVAEDKTVLPIFLKQLLSVLRELGCVYATPSEGSWLVAACDDALLTVYPMLATIADLTSRPMHAPDASIVVAGEANSIVKLVGELIRVARAMRITVYPIPL